MLTLPKTQIRRIRSVVFCVLNQSPDYVVYFHLQPPELSLYAYLTEDTNILVYYHLLVGRPGRVYLLTYTT